MSNYEAMSSIEKVELAETIELPKIAKLSYSLLESGGTWESAFDKYKDTKAKFFINIMTPLADSSGDATDTSNTSPSTRNQKGKTKLNTSSYGSSNYIELTIPKYILLNFTDSVPKGTKFLVGSINGSYDTDDMHIIGVLV